MISTSHAMEATMGFYSGSNGEDKIISESSSEYLAKLYRPTLQKSDREKFVCLDKNEPPFSAFDSIGALLTDDDIRALRTYPDLYNLYENLANFAGVDIGNLLLTFGSEQAIRFVFDTFVDEGDEVVYPHPSFAMFDVFSYYRKAKVNHLEYSLDMQMPLDYVLDSITNKTALFVLANPNNPTGTAFCLDEISQILTKCEQTNTIFLLDEAYFHYFDIDSISLIKKSDHIIITRTFSKGWGLAGARVGYAVASQKNINLLRKQKPIDEVSSLSMILCSKALDNSQAILDKNISQVKKWKSIFQAETFGGITYLPSEGNFILMRSSDYARHSRALTANWILPKMDFNEPCMRNCIRFSISTDAVMQKIIEILQDNHIEKG
jgi:histidinol-phosphate aminotransferase